jgi:hypothetical protein
MKKVVGLFNFSDMDMERLNKLSYEPNQAEPIDWKVVYKQIVCMVELFYRLCLAPNVNTTRNPDCEWQLQMFTKKTSYHTCTRCLLMI